MFLQNAKNLTILIYFICQCDLLCVGMLLIRLESFSIEIHWFIIDFFILDSFHVMNECKYLFEISALFGQYQKKVLLFQVLQEY